MQDLLIKDVDDAVITNLKQRAGEEGVTIEDKVRTILTQNVNPFLVHPEDGYDFEEWKRRLDEFREKIGPIQSDSTEHIREMRDSR